MADLERHKGFMKYALKLANNALHNNEVPVACVFVYKNQVISYGMNNTNDSLSGITHAEFRGINIIWSKLQSMTPTPGIALQDIFKEIDLYVTVEPCVMCASALKQIGIRNVYFGCGNERFGGNGSCLKINQDSTTSENNYKSYPGIYRKEAIILLRDFYTHENTKAPVPKEKKNRILKKDEFPPLIWSNYINEMDFKNFFGVDKLWAFEQNLDLDDEINNDILDSQNINIDDIIEWSNQPLPGLNKRRKT
ncbi:putative riboflavin biosynthesis protein [Wickerhamomyces ciferrii]|uniref:tRNA(adenine(34)) deaminase n=1 Tax=Wickerhamomyces ciferrii (strain ATCC 14091 / BCRC 22168 / CBS 111 / JCM 3599 / NBRC 0793 / NRRL Y-1031 F-60-10) TaxID=1206466 RepID=K0K7S4_WICCF|nr:putative riboflavin biosynthesis protein [Wickerhamomyces ciferrii]CCH40865.1 putative riboflavin biosynthesis protein [Wickerhamomyces ciferrii]